MTVCIDYSKEGIWIAYDESLGVNHYPRLGACGNPIRLKVVMQMQYPKASIKLSETASVIAESYEADWYLNSSLYKHDLKFKQEKE